MRVWLQYACAVFSSSAMLVQVLLFWFEWKRLLLRDCLFVVSSFQLDDFNMARVRSLGTGSAVNWFAAQWRLSKKKMKHVVSCSDDNSVHRNQTREMRIEFIRDFDESVCARLVLQ